MKTTTNRWGEKVTLWKSHKHPDNPNFMQVVEYMHVEHSDGRKYVRWWLNTSPKKHIIPNLTLGEALDRFTDEEIEEITEADFEKWLSERK